MIDLTRWLAALCTSILLFSSSIFLLALHIESIIMTSFAAAEREAVSAAEKAERKAQLRDKVSYFLPAVFSCVAMCWLCRNQRSTQSFLFLEHIKLYLCAANWLQQICL